MNEETLRRIYDPFFTTKEAGQGIGLGLSVVHGIVDLHDAHISVVSELGEGSRFSVYLPIIQEEEAALPVSGAEEVKGAGRHVLCVDDEVAILAVTGRILERQGFTVSEISEPKRAIEAFEESPDAFDLVLVDYFMPKLNGLDVVRRVRACRQDIPIILSSGNISDLTRNIALGEGVAAFLDKPYSRFELSEVLRTVFRSSKEPRA